MRDLSPLSQEAHVSQDRSWPLSHLLAVDFTQFGAGELLDGLQRLPDL